MIVFLYFFYSTGHKSPESIEKHSHLHFILVRYVTLWHSHWGLFHWPFPDTIQHTIDNRITSVHWFNVYRMGQKKEIMRISFYFSQEFFFDVVQWRCTMYSYDVWASELNLAGLASIKSLHRNKFNSIQLSVNEDSHLAIDRVREQCCKMIFHWNFFRGRFFF